jgi:hypothetical protein
VFAAEAAAELDLPAAGGCCRRGSFDHLVGASEEKGGYLYSGLASGSHVNDQLVFRGLLDRQLGRVGCYAIGPHFSFRVRCPSRSAGRSILKVGRGRKIERLRREHERSGRLVGECYAIGFEAL